MILLIAGIALALFSTSEPYTAVEDLQEWGPLEKWGDEWPSTLNPQTEPNNYTFWGRYMQRGDRFEFNVSASGSVRLTVSFMQQESQSMTPIFDRVGTRFDQEVGIGGSGTYHVEIRNLEAFPVSVWGNAFARRDVGGETAVHHYLMPGTLMALVGLALLVLGVVFTPGKSVAKRKTKR